MYITTLALKLRIILEAKIQIYSRNSEDYSFKYAKAQGLNNKHAMTLRMTSLKKTCGAPLKER